MKYQSTATLHYSSLMMEAARTSETSVDTYFTRQYIPEDNSELHTTLPYIPDGKLFILAAVIT
jgi:hypothetical protein